MIRALIAWSALLLAFPGEPQKSPRPSNSGSDSGPKAVLKGASIDTREPAIPVVDEQAEAKLLELANRDRAVAGLPPLQLNSGLRSAARNHAIAMADAKKLSHQFAGEASLSRRTAAVASLKLDQVGENVALDYDIASAQSHLMASPPHRRNLLDPDFNVAGFGVVRLEGQLYVVQDFGRRLETFSLHETEAMVANALNQWRSKRGLKPLTASPSSEIRDAACGLAQTNTLNTRTISELARRQSMLTYTQSHPEILPDDASRVLSGPQLKRASIGVCFARSAIYPGGVYWVALGLE